MKVWVYALCWNEAFILPYFLRHYLEFCERIVFFDNQSDDGSLEIIRSADKTEVRTYDTGGRLSDLQYLRIKNECWKEARGEADFVIVCDADEFLYAPDPLEYLKAAREAGCAILQPVGYEMMSSELPKRDGRLHQEVSRGYRSRWMDKMCAFQPGMLDEIGYAPGCHAARPLPAQARVHRSDGELKLLHFRFLGPAYTIERYTRRAARLSEINNAMGWGSHYRSSEQDIRNFFEAKKKELVEVIPGS